MQNNIQDANHISDAEAEEENADAEAEAAEAAAEEQMLQSGVLSIPGVSICKICTRTVF